jgi:hypothetical protein
MLFEKKVEDLRKIKHGGRETPLFLADVKKLVEGEAFEIIEAERQRSFFKYSDRHCV